jgi:hypothetical protein
VRFLSAHTVLSVVLLDWLLLFPRWLLVGLGLGAVVSVLIAGTFVVGGRLFPDGPASGAGPGPGGGRVDGTVRRRAEIRQYLLEIGEAFREDATVHGHTVAFYLPERDVAITFDAHAYFRLEARGTYAVLCEHEMPGRHLGRRLPFEVPEAASEPAAVDDPIARAFETFGLSPEASSEEVKSAYRDRVKEVHPDHGGDPDEFKRVREAYATARNHAD